MDSTATIRFRKPLITKSSSSSSVGVEEKPAAKEMDNGGEMTEPLSPSARLFHDPRFNCHIVAIVGVGKRIDADVVKAGWEATLVRHPRFSSVQ
ncbi:hypothetical protein ACLOJK_009922, partial [Asimina triloba]